MRSSLLLLPLLFIVMFVSILPRALAVRTSGSPTYHTKDVMITMWKTLSDLHPSLGSYEVIGKTVLNNDIWMFKIGNPNGARLMFDGSLHGTEDTGTEAEYLYAKWLLESGDAKANELIQKTYSFFIPVVNDQYDRKNGRDSSHPYPDGSTVNTNGIDLNRNFAYGWGSGFGSTDPVAWDYQGPFAASEPETQALRSVMQTYRPKIYVNFHVGGGHYGHYMGNVTLGQMIITKYNAFVQSNGVVNPLEVSGSASSSGSGTATSDAYFFGALAWVSETSDWTVLPDSYNEWVSNWYPQIRFLLQAMSESVAGTSSPPPPPPPPLGQIIVNAGGPYNAKPNSMIAFLGSVAGGNAPYSWAWSFGDGTSSQLQNPSKSYSVEGVYSASLTVTDSSGHTNSSITTASISSSIIPPLPPIQNYQTFLVASAVGTVSVLYYFSRRKRTRR